MQEPSLEESARLSDLAPSGSLSRIYRQFVRKEQIAEKVLSGKRLNTSEREEIYRLLTGKSPNVSAKKGRPRQLVRDYRLAVDYLYARSEGSKRTDKLRIELADKHGLLKGGRAYRDNTFYIALNKGIAEWHKFATYWLQQFQMGDPEFCTDNEEENQKSFGKMQRALQLIEDYKKAGQRLQKTRTE